LKEVLVAHQMEVDDIASVMAVIEGFKNAIVDLPTVTRTAAPGT
jgi:hypothetical protein